MIQTLDVFLYEEIIGILTLLTGDKSFFVFTDEYLQNINRPVLSQSFISKTGEILNSTKFTQTKLPPFFSNLLPEGRLRAYLAAKDNINPEREFMLIKALGEDLPGAITLRTSGIQTPAINPSTISEDIDENHETFRFSLAGIQLKFSAIEERTGGLTIPAHGVGGSWIIKLPSLQFPFVPENEWAMLEIARHIGIPTPESRLVDISSIKALPDVGILQGQKALAVRRFDRVGGRKIHIEDMAQVYGVFPSKKYSEVSYNNMASTIWHTMGAEQLIDFIKRLVFNALIGNADMHLKNWSLIYYNKRSPSLAPAYDFLSTIVYLPDNYTALSIVGEKNMFAYSKQLFTKLAQKAGLPKNLVIQTAIDTARLVESYWSEHKNDLGLPKELVDRINSHLYRIPLLKET